MIWRGSGGLYGGGMDDDMEAVEGELWKSGGRYGGGVDDSGLKLNEKKCRAEPKHSVLIVENIKKFFFNN